MAEEKQLMHGMGWEAERDHEKTEVYPGPSDPPLTKLHLLTSYSAIINTSSDEYHAPIIQSRLRIPTYVHVGCWMDINRNTSAESVCV